MGIEEQKEEREVLDSIFPDEITDVSETEYRISISLDVTNEDGDDSEPPTIILQVQYPENYPDEAPRLDLSTPPNAPKHKHLDIQEDKARLLEALEPTIEENMGMAMIFTLVSTLKDGAELLIAERQKAVQAQKEFEAAQAEEEENAKFHGSAVTRESFLAWREKFRLEIEEAEKRRQEEMLAEDKKRRAMKEEVRLTGKQLWERGLAGKGEEEDDGDESIDVSKLKIEA
ncbi:RWD-domain-containing protein [Rhizodiscina lignyota]|uniref:RWD-domain-containing protein n=1 Tax=Rhizodiscina lignyota TaxID=1504668 RepID=A0A9P4I4B6_9PEZI|nr:RWD-domain-containing protein [Rhizodiscina lignyota]